MIKKTALLVSFILFMQSVFAQKGIDALVNAEKSFAAFSVAHSTKEAFLQYIDSNSLMFDKGKPVKAQAFWKQREKRPGILNWHPQYAEISASGDFGYTTGPWTFQASATDSVAARGQYSTVWYRNNDGEWKFLIDLGVDNTPVNPSTEAIKIDFPKQSENIAATARVFPMVAAENAYIKELAKDKYKACQKYLSAQSILTRSGYAPAVSPVAQKTIIDSTSSAIKYTLEGWDISPVPDMGYVYGTTTLKGKTEGYFRVWRREKTGWKIALEVVRY